MTSNAASLDLALIGNCAYSALVDERGAHRLVLPAALRRRSGVQCAARQRRQPTRRQRSGRSSSRTSRAASRRTSRTPRSCAPACSTRAGQGIEITDFAPRFFSRDRMFRPLTLVRRVQGRCRPRRACACRCARASTGAAQAPAITQRQQPHPLRRPAQHAAPEHRRAARLTCSPRPSSSLDRPMNFMLGPGRDAARRHRGHRAPASSRRPPATGAAGPGAWRFRWSGRTR